MFLSNHTLQALAIPAILPSDVVSSLDLNSSDTERKKLQLKYHDFDMQPFFERDFKVLPVAIDGFEAASDCPTNLEKNIRRLKLSSIYQFIRAMPMLYVEACTRHG